MSDHNPTSATADLSVLAHLRSSLVNAAGVTDFGDQGVLLPLAAGIALLLALSGWRRGALAWTAAIGGTLALILLLKLRFLPAVISCRTPASAIRAVIPPRPPLYMADWSR